MSQLRTTIITRNDYDYEWLASSKDGVLVQGGELAISIPTRAAAAGETPIDGSQTQDYPTGRVIDTTKDAILKIGGGDTFYRDPTGISDPSVAIPNGSAGALTRLAPTGTFTDQTRNSEIEVSKNQSGETVISVRQAKVTSAQDAAEKTAQSGVLSAGDYLELKELADFFRKNGEVSSSSIEEKIQTVSPTVELDDSLERNQNDEIGVSDNIRWDCQGAL